MKNLITLTVFLLFNTIIPQSLEISKIEPPNWWSGHSYNDIQLMVYGKYLDSLIVEIPSDEIKLQKVIHSPNNNYAFIEIDISNTAKAGKYDIIISNKNGKKIISYDLFEKEETNEKHNGFSNEDVIYLIFPDRFVNGDQENDFVSSESEEFQFASKNGRYGGDIKGIISKLDYLIDLGVTTIWVTPLLRNDMYMSYHGYAATDFYNVDPRHGSNELYKELVQKAHDKGIKVIMDHVANHIGINHPWVKNLPTPTWINGTPKNHLTAEHNKTVYADIHADSNVILHANKGWFVDYMPDLNQQDPLLAKYIIQNTIWWIEYADIDGIREDTYPYADHKFMSIWADEILKHYPKFNIVGEVWKGEPAILAAFQDNTVFPTMMDSNLPVVTDFAIRDAIESYLLGNTNLNKIYEVFGKDFVYHNSDNLLVFFDNHDTDRGMYAAKGNIFKYKVALTLVLTTRGIPQLFYGSEIGLNGGGHHDRIREAFPGGFPNDTLNAFDIEGRNSVQSEIFDFTKSLLKLRLSNEALRTGEFVQYEPKDNIYVYKKILDTQKIMVVINDNDLPKSLNISKYLGDLDQRAKLVDVFTKKDVIISDSQILSLGKQSINVIKIVDKDK